LRDHEREQVDAEHRIHEDDEAEDADVRWFADADDDGFGGASDSGWRVADADADDGAPKGVPFTVVAPAPRAPPSASA
jgi:hypothetical protein